MTTQIILFEVFYSIMKKHTLYILAIILALTTSTLAHAAQGLIAAVVNDQIITISDVEDRVKLYSFSSDAKHNEQQLKALRYQVLNRLIDETLQLEEAKKIGIAINDTIVQSQFAKIAEGNKLSTDEMKKQFKKANININSLYDQIRAESAWGQLVQRKLRPKISISETDIDMRLETTHNTKENQYLVAEIFLNTHKEGYKDKAVFKKASQIAEQIREGAQFSLAAKEFSEAPGAASGGNLGWIKEGQVSAEIGDALSKMKKGQISNPVLSPKGYHIVLLRDIRHASDSNEEKTTEETAKSRNQVAGQLGMQRLMQMATHHLNDIRSTAFIEKRL